MVNRQRWLSLTPEPENELPRLVATLAAGAPPDPGAVAREEAKIEALILHGTEARWVAYLHSVVELIDRSAGTDDDKLACARARAIRVLANHHNLLLGVSARAAQRTAGDREHLDRQLQLQALGKRTEEIHLTRGPA